MTDATTSLPFPVLGPERLDYQPECSYQTSDWTVNDGDIVSLRHHLSGDCLVSRLVKEGKAKFACIVVVKTTMYRRTFVHDSNRELFADQTFTIRRGMRTVETPKMLPVVVYLNADKAIIPAKTDGLDPLWRGRKFTLPKAAILAQDRWHEFIPGIGQLLKIKRADNLAPGQQMRVDIAQPDGGYFLVHVTPALFDGIQGAAAHGEDKCHHRNSILTHALSVGFSQCAKPDEETGLSSLENFQTIKRRLKALDIPAWDDEDEFDPCRAACVIYPHVIRPVSESLEEEENE